MPKRESKITAKKIQCYFIFAIVMKFLSEEALSSFASTARKQTFLHFDTDIFNLQNCEPVVLKH